MTVGRHCTEACTALAIEMRVVARSHRAEADLEEKLRDAGRELAVARSMLQRLREDYDRLRVAYEKLVGGGG